MAVLSSREMRWRIAVAARGSLSLAELLRGTKMVVQLISRILVEVSIPLANLGICGYSIQISIFLGCSSFWLVFFFVHVLCSRWILCCPWWGLLQPAVHGLESWCECWKTAPSIIDF